MGRLCNIKIESLSLPILPSLLPGLPDLLSVPALGFLQEPGHDLRIVAPPGFPKIPQDELVLQREREMHQLDREACARELADSSAFPGRKACSIDEAGNFLVIFSFQETLSGPFQSNPTNEFLLFQLYPLTHFSISGRSELLT